MAGFSTLLIVTLVVFERCTMLTAAVQAAKATASHPSCVEHPWPTQSALRAGESLSRGGSLDAKEASLEFNATDGTIVLVRKSDGAVIWTPSVVGGWYLTLTLGGNLVVTNQSGVTLWESGTTNATILVVEDNCRATLYQQAPYTGKVWASNTPMCITAHITMHSHDDVGWLLTPEEYSDGCNAPGGGTNNIFTNMMSALAKDPSRRFSEVEMYFFERWWATQNESMRNLTRQVVADGQLEFINAGWSMHDEACVHQESAISNMEIGAQFLRNTFGNTMNITIGWHIDPFGHASSTPRLMAQMGFDAFFFWRTDYQQRQHMMNHKTVESMWHPSPSLGPSVAMFTSIMFNSYCMGCNNAAGWQMCPSGFYSFSCEAPTPWRPLGSDPNERSEEDDLPGWLLKLLKSSSNMAPPTESRTKGAAWPGAAALAANYVPYIRAYADYFRTGHVLIPWGCDFQHQDAHISFQLMDSVIALVNGNSSYGMKMRYSHPTDYIQAVHAMDYSWPRNEYDYFLDSDNGHAYWSGYFSSRAEYKGYERHLMNERFATEMAVTCANLTADEVQSEIKRISVLRQALGVAQHHDSITGTERVNVREQYQFLLARGAAETEKALSDSFASATGMPVVNCRLRNLSSCDSTTQMSAGNNVSIYVFNPLSRPRSEYITVPVPTFQVTAIAIGDGGRETALVSEVSMTWDLTTTPDLTSPPNDAQPYQVVFKLDMEPLQLREVVLVPLSTPGYSFEVLASYPQPNSDEIVISNEHYTVTFDAETQLVTSATPATTGRRTALKQNIMTYCPHPQGCISSRCLSNQASGAYIFRTCQPNEQPVPYATASTGTAVLRGPLCEEVRQYLSNSSNIHQSWRLCKGMEHIELTAGIGEIEMGPNGTEVILKISSDVNSAGMWYTDSEALEMQQRVRNQRPNYPYTLTEPVASNYFPCNAFAYINDTSSNSNLAVLADRSRATASLHDGELEFLVQRRLRYDDSRGVDQNLNETTRVLTVNRILLNSDKLSADMRLQSLMMTHPPVVRFGGRAPISPPYSEYSYTLYLPRSIHLHTRSFLAPGVVLLRLQHLFAVSEPGSDGLESPEFIDLQPLLPSRAVLDSIEEYDINGITPFSEIRRLDFKSCDAATGNYTRVPPMQPSYITGTTVAVLYPMDIRTFIIKYHM